MASVRDWHLWRGIDLVGVVPVPARVPYFHLGKYDSDRRPPFVDVIFEALRQYGLAARGILQAQTRRVLSVSRSGQLPLRTFVVNTGSDYQRWNFLYPPMIRFFDLDRLPLHDPLGHGGVQGDGLASTVLASGSRYAWIQPEVFARTGFFFVGGSVPAREMLWTVHVDEAQSFPELLVALDSALEGNGRCA